MPSTRWAGWSCLGGASADDDQAGTETAADHRGGDQRAATGAAGQATGEVITPPVARNDFAAFIRFLSLLDQCTAPGLRICLLMDNGSSHTSRAARAWIAAHPWKWKYDANAEHARYLERHPARTPSPRPHERRRTYQEACQDL